MRESCQMQKKKNLFTWEYEKPLQMKEDSEKKVKF
jgi:hypothetical protein